LRPGGIGLFGGQPRRREIPHDDCVDLPVERFDACDRVLSEFGSRDLPRGQGGG
jgi:hypothetical protein